jgi:hypothetical protein
MAELLVAARRTFLSVRCQTAQIAWPSGARRCYRPRVLLASTEVTTSGWVLYCFVGVAFVATMAVALVAVVRNGKQLRRLGGPDPALTAALDGKAQIVSSEWLGRVVNLEYVYRVVLRVEVAGRAPYEATVEQGFDPMRAAALQPGSTVAVRIAADDPQYVKIA